MAFAKAQRLGFFDAACFHQSAKADFELFV
jgi:hypothetical protein